MKNVLHRLNLTLALTFSTLIICLVQAGNTSAATLSGHVLDRSGQPLARVTVTVLALDKSTKTDQNGFYEISSVPEGTYAIKVSIVGYETRTDSVTLNNDEIFNNDYKLSEALVELGSTTVIGSGEDFVQLRNQMKQIPGSVALLPAQELRATRQANLKDVLKYVPGVWVQPRFGAADESQMSIRGTGLRNNFHLRGVNLLVNGMPYRNADGFTDFESLELLTTDNIQVYKGGNALRYGGSTLGGAVNMETKTGHNSSPLQLFAQGGSYGFYKSQVSSGDVIGNFNYYASYARTRLDGYREYSGQIRDRFNLHLGKVLSPSVNARLFYLYAWVEEDLPGTLTKSELEASPDMAVPNNVTNRWGRDYALHHVGMQIRTQLSERTKFELAPYAQYRDISHPIFQVIDQISRDVGVETRLENSSDLGPLGNSLTVGLQLSQGNIDNRRYQNVGGANGALTKAQRDVAGTIAVYAEDILALSSRLSAILAVRLDRSLREIDQDFFLTDGDQADSRTYDHIMPKFGAIYKLGSNAQMYANASRSVEPPILSELNSTPAPGFRNLQAQKAWQYEIGSRGDNGSFIWDLSAYQIDLTDELINFQDGFVPAYRNVAQSRHRGLECGLALSNEALLIKSRTEQGFGGKLAYTYAECKYVNDATYGNNHLPGLPNHSLNAEITYRHPAGLSIKPNVEWVPEDYHVNSANTEMNEGWVVLGLRGEFQIPSLGINLFLEGRNLTDEVYSASVSVDNSSLRFYEPADRLTVYGGFTFIR